MLDIAALTRCFELIPILAVKSHSVATGEHSSTRKGMQGAASKPGVANTRKAETKENIERERWLVRASKSGRPGKVEENSGPCY
jgi:hypothetical protein